MSPIPPGVPPDDESVGDQWNPFRSLRRQPGRRFVRRSNRANASRKPNRGRPRLPNFDDRGGTTRTTRAIRSRIGLGAPYPYRSYDQRLIEPSLKTGNLLGMGLTEKQGGSDVRANTSTAVPVNGGGPGGEYRLTGHKWFTSAPMCDAFLVLAQAPAGISCFLVPRVLDDGSRNSLFLMRLKDKVGKSFERIFWTSSPMLPDG